MLLTFQVMILLKVASGFSITELSNCHRRNESVIGDREVRLFNEKLSYDDAQARCAQWGEEGPKKKPGQLASILNEMEQLCIQDMIASPGNYNPSDWSSSPYDSGYTVGATDRIWENTWIWRNDEQVSYSNWAGPEPNDWGHGEDCMYLMMTNINHPAFTIGKWVDSGCNKKKFFICERETEVPSSIWAYNDNSTGYPPASWKEVYPQCGGQFQSPIDMNDLANTLDCEPTNRLVRGWRVRPGSEWIVENTGRFIKITPWPRRSMTTSFYGSATNYYVNYMILKWGDSGTSGSDHVIDGRRGAGELQVFHERHSPNQRHAIAFLLEDNFFANDHWDVLLSHIAEVQYPDLEPTRMVAPITGIRHLLGNDVNENVYIMNIALRYRGSLPNPPCSEDVIWTIFPRPIKLSTSQLLYLRRTRTEDKSRLSSNFRSPRNNSSPLCTIRS